jgi:hypothetical protein
MSAARVMTPMRLNGLSKAFDSVNCSPTSASAREGSQKTFGLSAALFACARTAAGRRQSASKKSASERVKCEGIFESRLSTFLRVSSSDFGRQF